MNQRRIARCLGRACGAVLMVASITACQSITDALTAKCGETKIDQVTLTGNQPVTFAGFTQSSATNQRRYMWSKTYQNVCTLEHENTNAAFTVNFKVGSPLAPTVFGGEGRVYQNRLFNPYSTALAGQGSQRAAMVTNVGLQQAWADGPGQMEVELLVTFPMTASPGNDQTSFVNSVEQLGWTVNYPAYKTP